MTGVDYEYRVKGIIDFVFNEDMVDLTGSATHFEDVSKYGEPYWAKDMIVTAKVGTKTFYKERN